MRKRDEKWMIIIIRIICFIPFALEFNLARDSEEDKLYLVRGWKRPFSKENKVDMASKSS